MLLSQDLEDELKSELGGDFQDIVVALLLPPRVFDARELRAAMKVRNILTLGDFFSTGPVLFALNYIKF